MSDVSKLSDADLAAVAAGDYSKVSDQGLKILAGETPPQFKHGAFDSYLQGASFGFADEIGAAKDSVLGSGTYGINLRDRGLARAQYERENPGTALSAELGGAATTSLIPGLGAYRAATAPALVSRLGPQAARYFGSAAGGATAGAVTGAGTAPEGGRMQGAVTGGVTGAVLGPAATGAFQLAGKGGQIVRDVTADIPVVKRAGQAAALATGNTIDYTRRAQEKLLQAMQRDQLSPEDIALASRSMAGKPETLVDRGGPNVVGLADVAAKYPGEARRMAGDLIEERMAGQGERLTADLSQAFRVQGDPFRVAQALDGQRAAAARPLYEKAYQQGAVIADPAVSQYMALPAFQRAYGVARRLATYDGVELPKDPRKLSEFSLQTLDYVKRGLDDVLYTGKVKGSIGNTERNKILDAQKGFLERLDAQVPAYAQARAAWAGPTAMKEALEEGQKVTAMTSREVVDAMRNFSPAQVEQFKIGALASIRDRMAQASDGRDLIKQIYGSPDKREILSALVGPEEFARLEQQFLRERTMRRVDDKIRGNSSTVERQIGRDDFEAETNLANAVVGQGPIRGGMNYLLRSGSGVPAATADAMAPMLFSTNPAAQQLTLQQLQALDRQLRARAAARGTMGGTAAGSGGGLLNDQGR